VSLVIAAQVFRVLIVDDDEDARVLLVRALGKIDLVLDVDTASDGLQALERIGMCRPDIVITDIMMPRMNGFDLCAALRADPVTAAIPVIMVTALEDDRDRQRGLAIGANEYLTKPFSWGVLAERLTELLGGVCGQLALR
jgi:two-component system alkaline phosphatase synthesis response regulator PhoP